MTNAGSLGWQHGRLPPAGWLIFFLALDALPLLLAPAYLAALQDGLHVAAALAMTALPLGPAASLSCYFAYRKLQQHH